ncbi:MAG: hypothetical protein D6722_27070, partial [Bacteroidetes bacterium]
SDIESATVLGRRRFRPGELYTQLPFFWVETVKRQGYLPASLQGETEDVLSWWRTLAEVIPLRLVPGIPPDFLARMRREAQAAG